MHIFLKILLMVARLLFVVQLLVGIGIWIGHAGGMTQMHIAIGSTFVLILWIIAAIALFALSARGLSLFTLLFGALVIWFGSAQVTFLPGAAHWTIRLLHLLLGLAAMGLIESLSKALLVRYPKRAS